MASLGLGEQDQDRFRSEIQRMTREGLIEIKDGLVILTEKGRRDADRMRRSQPHDGQHRTGPIDTGL